MSAGEAERAERSHAEVDGIVKIVRYFGIYITIIQYNCSNVFREILIFE